MKMNDSDYIESIVSKKGLTYLNTINFDQNLEESIGNSSKLLNTDFMKNLDKIVEKIV